MCKYCKFTLFCSCSPCYAQRGICRKCHHVVPTVMGLRLNIRRKMPV